MADELGPAHVVLQGGGVKGIALTGALSVLEERGYQPQCIAGTSAGAIVASLLAAGYSAAELREIVLAMDFTRFEDPVWPSRIPALWTTLCVLTDLGMYRGDAFLAWLRELLAAKGVHTFGDLVDPTAALVGRRHRLQVIASDITARRVLVLPDDADCLGLDPDALDVALAVRMSMSIPLFFEPVRHVHPASGEEHLIVDGGLLSNFPVWLFDTGARPEIPTFGLRLVEPDPRTTLAERLPPPALRPGLHADFEYLKNLVHTVLEAHDRLFLARADYARTIDIPTLGVRTTDFGLGRERSLALYEAGRAAAAAFLNDWHFQDYLDRFHPAGPRATAVAAPA